MSALDKHLFNLKFAAKELQRNAKKCDKQEREEKAKLTAAIKVGALYNAVINFYTYKKGNMEVAQVHAENAIRKKNESLNYMRMSARIDAVAARVQTAATQKRVTQSMSGVVSAMESAMRSMNLEKVQNLMDRFEKDFENLDVQSATMEGSMSATTTLNAPQAQVNALIQEAADAAGLELNLQMPSEATTTIGGRVAASAAENDELTQRLAALRQN
uniref:Charged multivesicular body protein 1b n=1 Tax=Syphacia muris TaxID=451379 RepID=A0A0N5AU83_9BILA